MPYASIAELPPAIKDKYSTHQQQVFVAAFNAAWTKTCKDKKDKEGCAFAIAHAAAQEGRQNMGDEKKSKLTSRMLNITLDRPKFEETDNGLMIRDVKILAEGTWTDSYQQTPCHYSTGTLKQYADNWHGNGYWLRHQGGSPRSIDEKVGEVRNPRYDNGAVMGDVFLHLATTKSRDHAEMVKRGFANNVSAELGTMDEWDAANKRYEATYLEFTGCASVDRGACDVCKIKNNEDEGPLKEDKGMDEETKKFLEALKVDLMGEMDKRFAAIAPAAKPEDMKALSDKMDASSKALEERLKVIENAPAPKTFAPEQKAGPSDGEKELERFEATRKLPRIEGKSIVCE
jgi:cation transport regulator ChaB